MNLDGCQITVAKCPPLAAQVRQERQQGWKCGCAQGCAEVDGFAGGCSALRLHGSHHKRAPGLSFTVCVLSFPV